MRLLLSRFADVHATAEEEKVTPLHDAVRELGSPDCVRLLLDAGAELEAKTLTNRTALHVAATAGNEACLRLLLPRGADVDMPDTQRRALPLHFAAGAGHAACVAALLDAGAFVNARGQRSCTPLAEVASSKRTDVAFTLLWRGADWGAPATPGADRAWGLFDGARASDVIRAWESSALRRWPADADPAAHFRLFPEPVRTDVQSVLLACGPARPAPPREACEAGNDGSSATSNLLEALLRLETPRLFTMLLHALMGPLRPHVPAADSD